MEKPPRPQLDRAAWVQAALDTLADEGVTGIRVEVLANYTAFRDLYTALERAAKEAGK